MVDVNDSDDHRESDESLSESVEETRPKIVRKRGRPRLDATQGEEPVKRQRDTSELQVDEAGEAKVDENGHLQDGRKYSIPSFTLPTRGDQLLMLAAEPARALGYRDSNHLFHRHIGLERVRIDDEEKDHLVKQGTLVSWQRHRDVAVVTARSIFKCFGHRAVVAGKRIQDDYFEQRAREQQEEMREEVPDSMRDITWMHRAALAASAVNTQLHVGRSNKPYVYDVHTNTNHVPLVTQSKQCQYTPTESTSGHLVDFAYKSPSFRGVGQDLLSTPTDEALPLSPPDMGSEEKDMYPLAIMKDQFQSSYPVHQTRFRQPEPIISSPKAFYGQHESLAAQQYYLNQLFEVFNRNLAKQNMIPPTTPLMNGTMVPNTPLTASTATSASSPGMSHYQCGYITQKGQSCRRPVIYPGARCQIHSPLATGTPMPTIPVGSVGGSLGTAKIVPATPSPATAPIPSTATQKSPIVETQCATCHLGLAPAPPASDEPVLCSETTLIRCVKCQMRHHPTCVGFSTPKQISATESYPWTCSNCNVCCGCRTTKQKDTLLICHGCDRAWHATCCQPSVDTQQRNTAPWFCPFCSDCHGCEDRQSDNSCHQDVVAAPANGIKYPVYLATFCSSCHDNFTEDRFCPVCLKTYGEEDDNEDEENDMVQCDSCDRWIHTGCDGILTPEKYQSLCEDETAVYACPLCSNKYKLLVGTDVAKKALQGQIHPSGCPVGLLGGKIRVRGILTYQGHKIGVPQVNGTGIAEMPSV